MPEAETLRLLKPAERDRCLGEVSESKHVFTPFSCQMKSIWLSKCRCQKNITLLGWPVFLNVGGREVVLERHWVGENLPVYWSHVTGVKMKFRSYGNSDQK